MKKDNVLALNLHTKMGKSLIEPKNVIEEMVSRGYHAVAITDENTVQAFPTLYKAVTEYNKNKKEKDYFKVLYGSELKVVSDSEPFKVTVIVRNQEGLKHLYELITLTHTKYAKGIPLGIIGKLSEGLLIGASAIGGEITHFIDRKTEEELADIMLFYDYIEVNYDDKKERVEKIIKLASSNQKLVVATGNAYCFHNEEQICFDVLNGNKENNEKQSLLSVEEMLEKFSFLDEEMRYHIVVSNPNKIKNLCKNIIILPENIAIPEIPNGDIKLTIEVYRKAHLLYGNILPKEVNERIAIELYGTPILKLENLEKMIILGRKVVLKKLPECSGKGILGSNHESMYLIPKMLVDISFNIKYRVESRGLVGASLVAYLLGITEVNPLPAHYRCLKCGHTIFYNHNTSSCFELENKNCPNCSAIMKKDGHDIPYASFLGVEASVLPDIDINFSDTILETIKKEIEKLFGKNNVFYPGVIAYINYQKVDLLVERYCHRKKIELTEEKKKQIFQKLLNVKSQMGIYPCGIIILPKNRNITEFTPVEKCVKSIITHFDYHDLNKIIPKFDILGHTDLTMLKEIENYKIDIMNIPFGDKQVFDLFRSIESLKLQKKIDVEIGTLGISEFYLWKGMKELKKLNIFPKNFSECVKILGLSHGTGTWEGNTLELLKQGIPLKDVIGHREDIMNKLLEHSVSYIEAYDIMEFIRKGKCKKELDIWNRYKMRMEEVGIEDWYIDSCEKITYLFPKAHHISYMINIYRFMYAKIYEPVAFYKAYFKVHSNVNKEWFYKSYEEVKKVLENKNYVFDEELVMLEAFARGIDMKNIVS